MRQKKFWFAMSEILAVVVMAVMLPTGAVAAGMYKALHTFKGRDGANPGSDVIFDAAGNLYGTTTDGGAHRGGAVFKLTPNSDGSWTETVLYSFCSLKNCTDGAYPTAGLIFDAAGNLYGTTDEFGGVYKLTPNLDGTWTESVLARMFRPSPGTDLIFDTAGNLYGETEVGGAFADGTVFKLTPNSDGSWTENDLYSFTGGADGQYPEGRLSLDAAGNLYGATGSGGNLNCPISCGVVFKLDANRKYSVLHSFTSDNNGARPIGGVSLDAAGNLYGTTLYGGNLSCDSRLGGCGVVFMLDTSGKYSVLHRFANHPAAHPFATVILDSTGNLYGPTFYGGPADAGTVFKMAPKSNGSWAFSVLHVFRGKPAAQPVGNLALDNAGKLYGTTSNAGGIGGYGVVFEIIP